jgi:probable rRNA maturation factor
VHVSDRQRSLRLDRRRLARDAAEVLRRTGFPGDLSLSLVDDREMGRIHAAFSKDPSPTDVLAFPLEGPRVAGADFPAAEVVVSVETALREARARGIPPRAEVLLYVVHGVLHLLGEDDHDPVRAAVMDRKTLRLLRILGYRNRIERQWSDA